MNFLGDKMKHVLLKKGELMPGGLYFYQLSGSQGTMIGKMVLLK